MKSEPVVTVATVTAFVGALIALVVTFGLDINNKQTAAILGMTTVLVPLLNIAARQFVTPTARAFQRTGGEHRA